jgi:HSP20 family protein
MPRDFWDNWIWQQAEDLLHEAEKIRWGFLSSAAALRGEALVGQSTWGPPINVIETAEAFWIQAALPGVEAGQVEIRIEGDGELVILGHRALRDDLKHGALRILEIPSGPFERRIRLPSGFRFILGEKSLEHGVLTIELRKVAS